MKPRHQVSRAAVEMIKRFEGYRQNAAQLPDGRWTIGYSHTRTARQGATVSEADAEALLLYDLISVTHQINELVFTPLTQNQFDALTSFTFNIGVDNFRRAAVLRRLNEGAYLRAAGAMEMWRRADFEDERIVVDALVRRRSAERTLFLTPPDGWVPASTSVLPPLLDFEPDHGLRGQDPQLLRTPLDATPAVIERVEAPPIVPPPALDEGPSAAETAAAVLSARLEGLVPKVEPSADAPAPVETLSEALPSEPEPEPTPVVVEALAATSRPSRWNFRQFIEIIAFATGVGFLIGAVMVGFDSASRPDALWRPETWGWMGGFAAVGLIMIGYGIYRGLSRLGDDDGDSPS